MTTIGVVQLAPQDGRTPEEARAAVERALDRIPGADLYLLPEIWAPGYFAFDAYEEAAARFDELAGFLAGLARSRGAYLHGGSLVERRGSRLHNTSLLFDPHGELVAAYRKIHLFGFGSREQEILTPGDEVVVADTELGRLGMAVCYDLRFPEQFRRMVDMGATAFLVASAWPYPRVDAWTTLLRARAIESQAVVVAANGAGTTSAGAALCGRSAIVDPWGVAIAAAGSDPAEFVAGVDLDAPRAARARFPELADRRLFRDEPGALLLAREGEPPLRFVAQRVVLGGYTARDEEAVRRYIAGLAAKGIPPPEHVPALFHVGRELVTTAPVIDVAGARTCGEVEFALLVDEDEIWVAAASDHTDRELEERSIPAAKQACPKPISPSVWRLSELRDHWDALVLRSFTPHDAGAPYQEAGVATLLHPDDLLALVRDRLGDDLTGTVVFGGSFASLGGGFAFHDSFRAELHDPTTGRTLSTTYRIHDVLRGGDRWESPNSSSSTPT